MSDDEKDAVRQRLLELKASVERLSGESGEKEICEAYTSDDERVDKIRLRGPSVVALADACNRCRAVSSTETSGSGLLRCSTCKVAMYCSKNCQREDWVYHKKWCKAFIKSGVNAKKALRVPLRRQDIVEDTTAAISQLHISNNLDDILAGFDEIQDEEESSEVLESAAQVVVEPVPPVAAQPEQQQPLEAKPLSTKKKSVRFAEDTKPAELCGSEATESCGCGHGHEPEEAVDDENGIQMGSFTVLPQGEDSMAWMRAFMHDPFENDDCEEDDVDDEDVSNKYTDLDEMDDEESEREIDPKTGRPVSEFKRALRAGRMPLPPPPPPEPTEEDASMSSPSTARPTATVRPVLERAPPTVSSPQASSLAPTPAPTVSRVVERVHIPNVISHTPAVPIAAAVTKPSQPVSRFAASRMPKS